MNEKLAKALEHISDRHIAEAAETTKQRRHPFLTAVAAVLALVLLLNMPHIPTAVSAKAVSTAEYPDYEWHYRGEEMEEILPRLKSFLGQSITLNLSGSDENEAYSPINLYMALALTAELSGGESRSQILSALNTEDIESLRTQTNEIWNACYYDDHNQSLLANSLWLNEDLFYHQEVMDLLAENYYTSVYQGKLGSSRTNRAIQEWLNNQTGGLLKEEVKNAGFPADLGLPAVFALYSTVYFQAKWVRSVEFSRAQNTGGIFHAPGGDISCTYMNKKELQTNYYWGDSFGAVGLGMKDGSRMWLILPDESKSIDEVLSGTEYMDLISDPDAYAQEKGKRMKVNLSLPKFDIRSSGDLKDSLEAMGVTDVFDAGKADFSESVNAIYPVWLTGVNQATRVAIDEEGVTAVSYIEIPGAGAAEPPEEIIDFILDRPFLFIITNRYDIPLFAGVVNEP